MTLVPTTVLFADRPSGWLTELRALRTAARLEYMRAQRKSPPSSPSSPSSPRTKHHSSKRKTRREREDELFAEAIAKLKETHP